MPRHPRTPNARMNASPPAAPPARPQRPAYADLEHIQKLRSPRIHPARNDDAAMTRTPPRDFSEASVVRMSAIFGKRAHRPISPLCRSPVSTSCHRPAGATWFRERTSRAPAMSARMRRRRATSTRSCFRRQRRLFGAQRRCPMMRRSAATRSPAPQNEAPGPRLQPAQ